MNPREYYHLKTAQITEADVRLVAACMTDHIGEQNAVRIEQLSGRVGFHERQVRDILAILVKQYGWPICANAGKAMLTAKIPNALELNRQEARVAQTGLF